MSRPDCTVLTARLTLLQTCPSDTGTNQTARGGNERESNTAILTPMPSCTRCIYRGSYTCNMWWVCSSGYCWSHMVTWTHTNTTHTHNSLSQSLNYCFAMLTTPSQVDQSQCRKNMEETWILYTKEIFSSWCKKNQIHHASLTDPESCPATQVPTFVWAN